HADGSVADLGHDGREGLLPFQNVTVENRVSLFAFAAVADVEEGETFILAGKDAVETQRIGLVLVNQRVLRLRLADLMEVDLMVFIPGRKFLALFWLWIAAVIKAVALPRSAGDFDPLQQIRQRLARGDFHHPPFLPVGTAI